MLHSQFSGIVDSAEARMRDPKFVFCAMAVFSVLSSNVVFIEKLTR